MHLNLILLEPKIINLCLQSPVNSQTSMHIHAIWPGFILLAYSKFSSWYKKVTSFGMATFRYSAVQPPFDNQLPLVIGLHYQNSVRVSLSAANIRRPGISNLHRYSPVRVPIHTLVEWSLVDSLLVSSEIHVWPW